MKVCVVDIFLKKMSLWSKTECRLNKIDVSHFFFFFAEVGVRFHGDGMRDIRLLRMWTLFAASTPLV